MYATLHASERLIAASRQLAARGPGEAPEALDLLCDQVCAEAGVWAPEAAGRALGQAAGDLARAVTLVRVWAATLPQAEALDVRERDLRVRRRVSATFADIPGGQWLGASPDFESRLLDWGEERPGGGAPRPLAGEEAGSNGMPGEGDGRGTGGPDGMGEPPRRHRLGRVSALLRDRGGVGVASPGDPERGPDPFEAPLGPAPTRGARMAALARGETGALVALASSAMAARREMVAAELCVGVAELRVPHPRTGAPVRVAEAPVTEASVLADAELDRGPGLGVGVGVTLGRLERRALAAAVLDGTLGAGAGAPPAGLGELQVLAAVDGLATAGFVDHLRLPHYASFASYLDRARGGGNAP